MPKYIVEQYQSNVVRNKGNKQACEFPFYVSFWGVCSIITEKIAADNHKERHVEGIDEIVQPISKRTSLD